jgi:hypothetical protein
MTVNEVYKKVTSEGYKVNLIGVVERNDDWRKADLEYADEFMETEGDREVFDFAVQAKQKILLLKF